MNPKLTINLCAATSCNGDNDERKSSAPNARDVPVCIYSLRRIIGDLYQLHKSSERISRIVQKARRMYDTYKREAVHVKAL